MNARTQKRLSSLSDLIARRPRCVGLPPRLASVFALASALFASSCVYSSKVKRDDFKVPARFSTKGSATQKRPPVGRFWKAFKNPELDRLLRLAFRDSLDLEVARARLDAAAARLGGATAGWYPKLGFSADTRRSASIFGPLGSVTQNSIQLSLSASYEVDLWGKVRYGRNAAKRSLAASQEDLRAAYITLAAQVTDTYYLLVQERAQVALLDETIKSREAQVELVKRRYQSGVLRAADLYQALGSLAAAKAQRAQVFGALRRGANALAALVGHYPGQVDAGKLDALPKTLFDLSAGIPGQLLLQRPDLRAAFLRLQAADQSVGAAFAAHFPSLSLGGTLGRAIEPTAGWVWSIFAGLTAPLFNGGAIQARYKERKAQLREAIAGFKKRLLMAVKETEDALIRGQTIAERIRHLETRVMTAEGALRISLDRYRQGLAIYLTVLTTEQALLGARTELLAARRELISARISLARALGGGWMDEDIARQRQTHAAASKKKVAPPATPASAGSSAGSGTSTP